MVLVINNNNIVNIVSDSDSDDSDDSDEDIGNNDENFLTKGGTTK